jgi:hypothetical protein
MLYYVIWCSKGTKASHMTGYGAFGAPIAGLAKGVRCVDTYALARLAAS